MNCAFLNESERMRRSWDQCSSEYLNNYLVSDVEDPRINFQSVLTRALIADTLFPGRFDELIDAELQFALCMTWVIQRLCNGENRLEVLKAIDDKDTSTVPEFVISARESLLSSECPILDYIEEALLSRPSEDDSRIAEGVLQVFSSIWNRALILLPDATLSICEPACGSANDYRFIVRNGLARFLQYTGFDISQKNIENAHRRFPHVDFYVGNVLDIHANDAAFDCIFIHDLFEHLSSEAFERALDEVLRITKKQAWLSFFNLDILPDHEVRPVDNYSLVQKICDNLIDGIGNYV
jgi:SAM-dependent methyltransferase